MFTHLETELAAVWHKLVTGTEQDIKKVLEWISLNYERKLLMTIADDIIAIKAAVSNPVAPVVDLTPVTAALADVKTAVDDIDAKLTPTPPDA